MLKLFTLLHAIAFFAVAQTAPAQRTPDVPYVPTSNAVVTAMLRLAGVTAKDVVYDLGCGDGRIVIAAAREFGARGVGVEIDPRLVAEARASAKAAGVERLVRIEQKDLFEASIAEATVVALYLLPSINQKLRPKLLKELKQGTRIVCHRFDLGADWPPERELNIAGSAIFLWRVPASK